MKKNIYTTIMPILSAILACVSISVTALYKDNFHYNEDHSLIYIMVMIVLMSTVFLYFMLYMIDKKKDNTHYDNIRASLEKEIADIQKKLSTSEEQWKNSNHLILSSQERNHINSTNRIDTLDYLKNFGLKSEDYIVDDNMIFFLTPFGNAYQDVYFACKETCENINMNLFRGDEKYLSNDIFSQIIRYIVKANIIIANIDSKNPNVFYELGIAHTLGKRIILISNRNDSIPFDIQQYRILFYQDLNSLKEMLPKYIDCALQDDKNPNEIIQSKISSNKYKEQIHQYESELKNNPKDITILNKMFNLYLHEKQYKQAKKIILEILKIDPSNENALKQLGKIQYLLNDTGEN